MSVSHSVSLCVAGMHSDCYRHNHLVIRRSRHTQPVKAATKVQHQRHGRPGVEKIAQSGSVKSTVGQGAQNSKVRFEQT